MAELAVGTERSRVNVVATVAATAAHRDCNRVRRGSRVASVTIEAFVCTIEHKAGLLVVIELPDQPVVGVVAEVAVRAETLLMNVVFAMAVDALIVGVSESRIGVTAFAPDCGV
jgi:hypothetical protein